MSNYGDFTDGAGLWQCPACFVWTRDNPHACDKSRLSMDARVACDNTALLAEVESLRTENAKLRAALAEHSAMWRRIKELSGGLQDALGALT